MSEPLFHILLIDDDEDDLEILSSLLFLKGIRSKCFDSGEKAIYYLQFISDTSDLPSLIILDYNMPRINGQQILQLIKNNKPIKDIPVVMYSTSMSSILKKALMELGALDCYAKAGTYSDLEAQAELFKNLADSLQEVKGGIRTAIVSTV